jgi:GH15 family glucan-1,4-alpha-glucosidase
MPSRIEDYGFIGDCQTGALVARNGSMDWLCFPRFDSPACFAALLGDPEHGRWLLTPAVEIRDIQRRYRDDTLVLETTYETDQGTVTIVDCMPVRGRQPDVVRLVVGQRGQVQMHMELIIRFEYGAVVPWVRWEDGGIVAIAGPDMLHLRSPIETHGEGLKTVADFTVTEGQRLPFVLTWHPSYEAMPSPIDPEQAIAQTTDWWREWSGCCTYTGPWQEAVIRSLITLKALTYMPTGGIVAAATTSLPEKIGGTRNWDYRYCWLRDATFTLYTLITTGYVEEARAWRDWLLRAVAGSPAQLQIMYGIAGERRLTEVEVAWLPGYEGSAPVRIGNAAHKQHQLDVFGEVMDTLYYARRAGLQPDENAWRVQRALLDFLESDWQEPDEGIWEVRGPQRHFTHSKVMAWVAMDRAVKAVQHFGMDGPVERWQRLRQNIHDQVCRDGFDADLGAFTQYYGSKRLDASLLMIPLVGFLPATDPRVRSTVLAVQRHLTQDGFVRRYIPEEGIDGLPHDEGVFLLCTFWLADTLALLGNHAEARRIFERLLTLRNDVGLLSEQYDVERQRLIGNFPQAFSHVALINTAKNLTRTNGAEPHRGEETDHTPARHEDD